MTVLAAAIYAQLATSLVLFGAALFPFYSGAPMPWRVLRASAMAALTFGLIATALHMAALQATLAELADTGIGRVWFAQIALAGAALLGTLLRVRIGVVPLAAIQLALFGLVGHANAIAGWNGAALQALHLLAAGGWIGGLVALMLALRAAPSPALVKRFSAAGTVFVLALSATGAATLYLISGAPLPMLDFHYGQLAALKVTLFAAALLLAAFNRFYATPRDSWTQLRRSIAFEIALLAFVIAVAVALSGTEPLT